MSDTSARTPSMPPESPEIEHLHTGLSRVEMLGVVYRSIEYAIGAGVDGDIAEFGTMSGDTAAALAKGLADYGRLYGYADVANGFPTRALHLFDSFEGLPESDSEADRTAPHVAAGLWAAGTCRGISPQQLNARYVGEDRVRVHVGWFRDTLPLLARDTKFAVVHIDCDLYQSAYEVLDHLVGNRMLSDGAMLLFDDWNCNRASPAHGERKAFAEIQRKYGLHVSDVGHYGFAAKRMIVHC